MISKTYTDRVKKPLWLKLCVPWWFGNDNEPTAPDWYLPTRQWLWRQLCWYGRNPLVNFTDYIIGVVDRNYTAYGQDPIELTDWHDANMTGWKFGALHVARIFWLPYVSYSGKRVLWHVGWYATGAFQIKFNILK